MKLADFGSAVELDKTSRYGYRKGTMVYMAPEVNKLSEGESFEAYSADMYSLGVCLHVMLFGEYPKDENLECLGTTTDTSSVASPCFEAKSR
jgi:serine/threonine protein kinase